MKEKIKQWIKDPYNLAFLIILFITIYMRIRYLFQGSVWVDETAYMLAGHDFAKWPIDMLILTFRRLHFIPEIVIAFFTFIFSPFVAGRMMALTYAILGLIFIYKIGEEMKNKLAGLIAAILISFNPYMWFYGSRALIDSPLTTMFIISTYFFLKYINNNSLKNLIIFLVILMLSIFTKYVAILFIFIIIGFYLLTLILKPKLLYDIDFKQLIYLSVPLILIGIVLKRYVLTSLPPLEYTNFYINQMPSMIGNPIIILALIGIIFSLIYKKQGYLLITSWSLVVYAAFSFLLTGSYPRYVLPAIPGIILLAGIGLTESIDLGKVILSKIKIKINSDHLKIICTIILLFFVLPSYYEAANTMILRLSYPFSGYDEAGEWIKNNVEKGSKVYVMSTSWAALFSGYDGFSTKSNTDVTFMNTAIYKNPQMLINEIEQRDKPTYLIIDKWESSAQPKWLSPSLENINNIMDMDFELLHVITKKYPITQEELTEVNRKIKLTTLKIDDRSLSEIPAIFIFKKIKK